MMTSVYFPWGKLTRSTQPPATHSLLDHMTDVAAVMAVLVCQPSIARALERTAGRSLHDSDRARLTALAFLHDLGKANAGFQGRYWDSEQRPAGWPGFAGHGSQGWDLIAQWIAGEPWAERVAAGLPLDAINNHWGDAWLPLLHASISHHGQPVADEDSRWCWQAAQHQGQVLYEPAQALTAIGAAVLAQYPQAFVSDAPELPASAAFSHLFAGLVQLADWLASDNRPGFFAYTQSGEVRSKTASTLADKALKAIGLITKETSQRLQHTSTDFAQVFGLGDEGKARPMQTALADLSLGPVVVLEAETGSGKTEAALWRFLHLWRAGQVDALYFALPTRVAATQLYERVQAFVQRAWGISGGDIPVVVRALPGYAAADGHSYQPLPGFQVLWSDQPGDAQAERRWAAESPKRYLAAPIAVGTIDQALLAALQVKHAHLRHALLARSLLVIDEVHASDAYMTRLTEQLLQAHTACAGQALLLSATLGAVAQSRYLHLGQRGPAPLPTLEQAQALAYPAISHRHAKGVRAHHVEGNARHKTVHWALLDAIADPQRIAALAVNAAAQGARVLVVRNTVPAAIATVQAVEALAQERSLDVLFKVNGVSTLHHSRFSRADRPLLDAQVQAQMGKERMPRPGDAGLVIVGTQTLEQSLDIDADLLITDLCPMDVLLQRLGRLHRHHRAQRPAGFEQARAWVLTPAGHNLAPLLQRQQFGLGPIRRQGQPMGGVYPDVRVLLATQNLIAAAPTRSIPADNRLLVEQATHPNALDAIAQTLGAAGVRFAQEYEGALAALKTTANLHTLAFEKEFGAQYFPPHNDIGTRLGAADRLLVFEGPAPIGPFGQPVQQLALRHHLVEPGLPPDTQPQATRPLEGEGFDFSLGVRNYRYSRWGLERLP